MHVWECIHVHDYVPITLLYLSTLSDTLQSCSYGRNTDAKGYMYAIHVHVMHLIVNSLSSCTIELLELVDMNIYMYI